jgi:hypothetical protein
LECRNADLPFRIVSAEPRERPDAPHALALLRQRRNRPRRRRTAEQRDEFAPSKLIKLHPLPLARVAA